MPKKTGPKGNYIKNSTGEIIHGLSYYKSKKTKKSYHYANYTDKNTGNRKRQYFSQDKKTAIKQFEIWKSAQEGDKPIKEIDIADIAPPKVKTTDNGYIEWENIPEDENIVYDTYDIATGERLVGIREDIYWNTVENDLRNNPQKVARMTGVEEISYLDELKPKPIPLLLKEIGNIYFNRKIKPLKNRERSDSVRWWKQFCKIIDSNTARDISLNHILTYQDKLYEIYHRKGRSPTWIKHRFDKIKTIFNYATKSRDVEYIDDLNRILGYCKKFQYPDKVKLAPNPIDKYEYLKILNVANIKQKAILLLAANAALYPQDCCDLKKAHINLKKQTLVMVRGKTGVPRVAMLWDRTVEAINNLNKEKPNNYDFLFVNNAERLYTANGIGDIWRKLRVKAGVDHAVKFEHIRDAAQTAAAEADCTIDEIRFLMG